MFICLFTACLQSSVCRLCGDAVGVIMYSGTGLQVSANRKALIMSLMYLCHYNTWMYRLAEAERWELVSLSSSAAIKTSFICSNDVTAAIKITHSCFHLLFSYGSSLTAMTMDCICLYIQSTLIFEFSIIILLSRENELCYLEITT